MKIYVNVTGRLIQTQESLVDVVVANNRRVPVCKRAMGITWISKLQNCFSSTIHPFSSNFTVERFLCEQNLLDLMHRT